MNEMKLCQIVLCQIVLCQIEKSSFIILRKVGKQNHVEPSK